MSKILNINDNIKINKNNLQTPYTIVRKSSDSTTNVTFTFTQLSYNGNALILLELNGSLGMILVAYHNYKLFSARVIVGSEYGVSASISDYTTLNITLPTWSEATLIDFRGIDTWS